MVPRLADVKPNAVKKKKMKRGGLGLELGGGGGREGEEEQERKPTHLTSVTHLLVRVFVLYSLTGQVCMAPP